MTAAAYRGKKRKRLRLAKVKSGRRCVDCGKRIDDRGPKASRCEKHAAEYLKKWRKKYDAQPHMQEKRRKYGAKKENIAKFRVRRNRKNYLLTLFIRTNKWEGMDLDQLIAKAERRLKSQRPRVWSNINKTKGKALEIADYPWKTDRGKKRRRKRAR